MNLVLNRFCFTFFAFAILTRGLSASEEDIIPWQTVVITSANVQETGKITVEASGDGNTLVSLVVHAFGRKESLGDDDLKKLAGFPLSGIVITHEAGYESLGGHTVNLRFKRSVYDDGKTLKTEVIAVTVPKNGKIRLTKLLQPTSKSGSGE